MEVDPKKFEQIKGDAEIFYRGIGEVICPFFKEPVSFNAKGLDHIKFKEWNKARSNVEQYIRFRLLPLAPQIIRESNTLQEFYETKKLERQKINSRWEHRAVQVRYYAFVAIIRRARVKVVVKDIEGGKRFFWSIIPFWKVRRDSEGNRIKKILHEGDLETQ